MDIYFLRSSTSGKYKHSRRGDHSEERPSGGHLPWSRARNRWSRSLPHLHLLRSFRRDSQQLCRDPPAQRQARNRPKTVKTIRTASLYRCDAFPTETWYSAALIENHGFDDFTWFIIKAQQIISVKRSVTSVSWCDSTSWAAALVSSASVEMLDPELYKNTWLHFICKEDSQSYQRAFKYRSLKDTVVKKGLILRIKKGVENMAETK